MEFPKKLYVKVEDSGDGDPFLVAETDAGDIAELGAVVPVGIYELREVSTVHTSVTVE